jgi:hypothetical protein
MSLRNEAISIIQELSTYLRAHIPDRNCSCHLSPPCSDCIDYGAQRSLASDAEDLVRKLKAAELIDPEG